jgi:hypothetical protein
MERWKAVRGYKDFYEVSNRGRVKSLPRHVVGKDGRQMYFPEKILSQGKKRVKKTHYLSVALCKHKDPKNFLVHRLVAIAFLPNPEKKRFVNHKDGVKTNNHSSNLEWCTSKENAEHASKLGLLTGRNHGGGPYPQKLNKEQVLEIRRMRQKKIFARTVAKQFSISEGMVREIEHRRTWRHV